MKETKEMLPHLRLQLNIKHPNLEVCWLDGYEMAQEDLAEDENPYPENSKEFDYWSQGWWAGFYHDEKIFSCDVSEIKTLSKVSVKNASEFFAANEAVWSASNLKKWAGRAVKVAGVIAATVVAVELIDIAV